MKVGDLVRVKWGGHMTATPYWLGIPCVLYSVDYGACKVYDPFDETIRTMTTDRIELINEFDAHVCR